MMEKNAEKRQVDRIETIPALGLRLQVQGVVREVFNISDHGFGIWVDTPNVFHLGQQIDDICLDMAGKTHRLQGAVAHITRTINGHLLGIRLKFSSIEDYRLMVDLKQYCSSPADDQ